MRLAAVTSVQAFVNPVCHQTPTGQISFAPAGGTPGYTYFLNQGQSNELSNNSGLFENLTGGAYIVSVEDNNGCNVIYSGIPVVIINPAALNISSKV